MYPILLVEDNPVNQKVGVLLLERLGLEVEVANNGREAVESYNRRKFSVILMDCKMPEMDGFEATRAIRKIETQSGGYTPIIAITALAMSGDQLRCIASGMDDYLSKPVDTNLLKLKLNHWLQADVVHQNQKLARKFQQQDATEADQQPIDISELMEFFTVEQVRETLFLFLAHTEDMIRRTNFFIKEKNAKVVAGLAHEMRASCASIGAKQLSRLLLYLEQSAGLEDLPEAEDTMKAFEIAFEKLKRFINENILARTVELKRG
jgi:CheY-like chemotaxis protein